MRPMTAVTRSEQFRALYCFFIYLPGIRLLCPLVLTALLPRVLSFFRVYLAGTSNPILDMLAIRLLVCNRKLDRPTCVSVYMLGIFCKHSRTN